MNSQQMIVRSPLCLLALLGLTLFASPLAAQVFAPGPSDPSLFDNVINVPPDPNIGDFEFAAGLFGITVQLNVFDGGSIGVAFDANSGSELNISGGTVGDEFFANSGSVVNISGGTIGDDIQANNGSTVNISGGSIGDGFHTFSGSVVNISGGTIGDFFNPTLGSVVNISGGSFGEKIDADASSEVNLFGSDFVLDGVPLDGSLTIDEAFTVSDRDVLLSGLFTDGSAFSFDLSSNFFNDGDFFHSRANLTVTLVPSLVEDFVCDVNQDGEVNLFDIAPFIAVLTSNTYLAEADCNLDGEVNLFDIAPFIFILTGG